MTQLTGNLSESSLTVFDLLRANALLAFYKAIAVIPTQPLQVLIRAQQAGLASKTNPVVLNIFAAAKQIANHESNGRYVGSFFSRAKPFFNGGAVGVGKELLKNGLYKGALIQGAPSIVDKMLYSTGFPVYCSPLTYHLTQSVLAGLFAGAMDTLIGGGLESWATFRSTSLGKNSDAKFWSEVGAKQSVLAKIGRIYKGAAASTGKGSVAFATNFICRDPINQWVVSAYKLQDPKALPWHGNVLSATLTGGLVALTSSPLDIIKTLAQKPNPNNDPMFTVLKGIIAKQGIKGITAGVPLKFLMVTIGWGITNCVIPSKGHISTLGHSKIPASQALESLPQSEEENQSGPSFRA